MAKLSNTILYMAVFIFLISNSIGNSMAFKSDTLNVGLIRYYSFEETSGTATEMVYGIRNLTNGISCAQGVSGIVGNAYNYTTDINSYSIDTTGEIGMPLSNSERTINFWIYNYENPPEYSMPFFYGDNYYTGLPATGTTWRMRFLSSPYISFSGNGADWDNVYAVQNNNWTMITLSYNGTDLEYFKNGISQGTQTIALNTSAGNACLMLGGENSGCEEQASNYWGGKIDELGIWNRTLNNTEITELYNSGNGTTYYSYTINWNAIPNYPTQSAWSKQRLITGLNSTSIISYITIPYYSGMATNFGDVRFTNTDKTSQLPYYIEYANTTSASFRVLTNNATSIYVFYGGPTNVTTSSLQNIYGSTLKNAWLFNNATSVPDAVGQGTTLTSFAGNFTTGITGTGYIPNNETKTLGVYANISTNKAISLWVKQLNLTEWGNNNNRIFAVDNTWEAGAWSITTTTIQDDSRSSGLNAYWALNETSGTIAYDTLGIWNATLMNSPSWESGLIGNAINLSGSATYQYLNLSSSTYTQLISSGTNPTSISMWIKPTLFDSGDTYSILLLANVDNSSSSQFIMHFGSSTNFGFGFRGSNVYARYDLTFQELIDQDKFTNIIAMYKGGDKTDANNYELYINGTLYTAGKTMIGIGGSGVQNILGIDIDGTSGWFAGKIDEIGIWNHTLNSTEITDLYNSGNGIPYGNISKFITTSGIETAFNGGTSSTFKGIEDESFHNIIVSPDYNTNTYQVYFDGIQVGTNISTGISDNNKIMQLFGGQGNQVPYNTTIVDDVMIFNSSITLEQVTSLFKISSPTIALEDEQITTTALPNVTVTPIIITTKPINFSINISGLTPGYNINLNVSTNTTLHIITKGYLCYQETTNQFSLIDDDCGLNYNGTYSYNNRWSNDGFDSVSPLKVFDGDWNTYNQAFNIYRANLSINYTKPLNNYVYNATWEVKDGSGIYNLTIPQSCWDANATSLNLAVTSDGSASPTLYTNWYCINNTSDVLLLKNITAPSGLVYEEAIIWNQADIPINTTTVNVNITLNNLIETIVSIPITLSDGLYNWFWSIFGLNGNQIITTPLNEFDLQATPSPNVTMINPNITTNLYYNTSIINISADINDLSGIANSTLNINIYPPNWNSGLYLYYNLNDNSISTILDLINNITLNATNYLGQPAGLPNYPGKYETSYLMNDSSDLMYPISPNSTILGGTNNFTVSMWTYSLATSAGEHRYYWQVGNQVNPSRALRRTVTIDGGYLTYRASPGECNGLNNIPLNQWVNIITTYDGINARVYLNGTLEITCPQGAIDSNVVFNIGWPYAGAGYSPIGYIDEVAVWNKTLSPSEINSVYNNGTGVTYVVPIIYTNTTTYSPGVYTTVFSQIVNLTDGFYNWVLNVYNYANLNTQNGGNFTIDTTNPQISFVSPTQPSGANISSSNLQITVNINEINPNNITYNVWNSTWSTIFTENVNYSSHFCYQENASNNDCNNGIGDYDTSNAPFLTCTLGANSDMYDENWSTECTNSLAHSTQTFYVNYSRGNYTKAIWQSKQGNGTITNTTLPTDCLNLTNVSLKIILSAPSNAIQTYCKNTTDWDLLFIATTPTFYEEAMIWDDGISVNVNTYNNYTHNFSLNNGIYLYNATTTDIVNNFNSTETRQITLDTQAPNGTILAINNYTDIISNYTYYNYTNHTFILNTSDNIALKNATLYINAISSNYTNITTIDLGSITQNLVSLPVTLTDGIYNWFWTIMDWAENLFTTSTQTTNIDTANPNISINYPANGNNYTTVQTTAITSIFDANPANLSIIMAPYTYPTGVDCYQETATSATACGGLATGTYGSFIEGSGPTQGGFVLMNYTKPSGYLNATWQIKIGTAATQNVSLPAVCQNAYPDKLVLRLYGRVTTSLASRAECYDGTTWQVLVSRSGGTGSLSANITEEVYDGNWSTAACSGSGAWWTGTLPYDCSEGAMYEEAIIWRLTNTVPAAQVFLANTTWYNTEYLTQNPFIEGNITIISNLSSDQGYNNWSLIMTDQVNHISATTNTFFIDSIPPVVTLVPPSDTNNSYVGKPYIIYNATAFDNNLVNLTVQLFNSDEVQIGGNRIGIINGTSGNVYGNISGLPTDNYYLYAYACDIYNCTNTSNLIHLDLEGPIINFTEPTPAQNNLLAAYDLTSIFANITIDDLYPENVSLTLTGPGNYSSSINSTYILNFYNNFTNLTVDGVYNLSALVYDRAGNVDLKSKLIYITGNSPYNMSYEFPTPLGNGITLQYIPINVSVIEPNIKNITIRLFDTNGSLYNISTSNSYVNNFYTKYYVPDGQWYFNATAYDIYNHQTSLPQQMLWKQYGTGNTSICKDISFPGEYTIVQNLNQTTGVCLNILTTGVTIDCQGYSITVGASGTAIATSGDTILKNCNLYSSASGGTGLSITGGSTTISNSILDGFYGVYINSGSVTISNSTIANNVYGLFVTGTARTSLTGVTFTNNQYGIYHNYTIVSPGGSSGSQVWGPSGAGDYNNLVFSGTATDIITLLGSSYNNFKTLTSSTGGGIRYINSSDNYMYKGTLGTSGIVLTQNSINNKFHDVTYSGTESVDSSSQLIRSWTTTVTTKDSQGNSVGGTTIHVNDGSNRTIYTNPDGTIITDINQYINNGTVTVFNPYEIFGVLTDYGNSLFTDTQITTVDDETQVNLTFSQQIKSTLLSRQVGLILMAIILLIGLAASTGFFIVKMRNGESVVDIWKYFIIMMIWNTIFLVLFIVLGRYVMQFFYP